MSIYDPSSEPPREEPTKSSFDLGVDVPSLEPEIIPDDTDLITDTEQQPGLLDSVLPFVAEDAANMAAQADEIEGGDSPDIESLLRVGGLTTEQERWANMHPQPETDFEMSESLDDFLRLGRSDEEIIKQKDWYAAYELGIMGMSDLIMEPGFADSIQEEWGFAAGVAFRALGPEFWGRVQDVSTVPVLGDITSGFVHGLGEINRTVGDLGAWAGLYDESWVPSGLNFGDLAYKDQDVNMFRGFVRGFGQYAMPMAYAMRGVQATRLPGLIRGAAPAMSVRGAGSYAVGVGVGGYAGEFVASNPFDGNGLLLQLGEAWGLPTDTIKDIVGVEGEDTVGGRLADKFRIALQGAVLDGPFVDGALKGLGLAAKKINKKRTAKIAAAGREAQAQVMARNARGLQLRSMGYSLADIETRLKEENLGIDHLRKKYIMPAYAELAADAYGISVKQAMAVFERMETAALTRNGTFRMDQILIDTQGIGMGSQAPKPHTPGTYPKPGAIYDPPEGPTRAAIDSPQIKRIQLTPAEQRFFEDIRDTRDVWPGDLREMEELGLVIRSGKRGAVLEVHGQDDQAFGNYIDEIAAWYASTPKDQRGNLPNLPPSMRDGTFGFQSEKLLYQRPAAATFKGGDAFATITTKVEQDLVRSLAGQVADNKITRSQAISILETKRASAIAKDPTLKDRLVASVDEVQDQMFLDGELKVKSHEAMARRLGLQMAHGTEVRADLPSDIARWLKTERSGKAFLDDRGNFTGGGDKTTPEGKAFFKRAKFYRNRYMNGAERGRSPDGALHGAPSFFRGEPFKLEHRDQLVQHVRQMTRFGQAGRHWYEESSLAIMNQVGQNVDDAELLAQFVAATSPQNAVKPNMEMAVAAYNWYKFKGTGTGKKNTDDFWNSTHKGAKYTKTGSMDKNLQQILSEGGWNGRKTNNFYVNLMLHIDPQRMIDDPDISVIDIHMMRALGYAHDSPTNMQYSFAEGILKDVADELNAEGFLDGAITPYQVQAMAWTAQKEIRGNIRNMIDAGDVTTRPLPPESYDFSDVLNEDLALATYEVVPHPSTGTLPNLESLPFALREMYTQDIEMAWSDDDGVNALFRALGLPDQRVFAGNGIYEGQMNPARQAGFYVPRELGTAGARSSAQEALTRAIKKGKATTDTPLDEWYAKASGPAGELLSLAVKVIQVATRQEAMAWHKPFPLSAQEQASFAKTLAGGKGRAAATIAANGMDINGVKFSQSSIGGMEHLRVEMEKRFGEKSHNALYLDVPGGIRVVNFGDLDNVEFLTAVKEIIENGEGTHWQRAEESGFTAFKTDGDYTKHNWAEDPDGRSLLAEISKFGDGSLAAWFDDHLGPRIQAINDYYSDKHGAGSSRPILRSDGKPVVADTDWLAGHQERAAKRESVYPETSGADAGRDAGAVSRAYGGESSPRPLRRGDAIGRESDLLIDNGVLPKRMYHMSAESRVKDGLLLDKSGTGASRNPDQPRGVFLYAAGHRMEPSVEAHYGPTAVLHEVDTSNMRIAVANAKGVSDPRVDSFNDLLEQLGKDRMEEVADLVGVDGIHNAGTGITRLFRDVAPAALKHTDQPAVTSSVIPHKMPVSAENQAYQQIVGKIASPDGVRTQAPADLQAENVLLQGDQSARGYAQVSDDTGMTIIGAMEDADLDTFVHEIGHAVHAQIKANGDAALNRDIEEAFGVKDGNWEVDNYEAFAEAWERYFAEPGSVTGGAKDAVELVAANLRDIWRRMPEEMLPRELDPKIRKLLDDLDGNNRLPFQFAPGKYMKAVDWSSVAGKINAAIRGMASDDIETGQLTVEGMGVKPGDILKSARGSIRKTWDEEASGPLMHELDFNDPEDFQRAIAAMDNFFQTIEQEHPNLPRDWDAIRDDAKEEFLSYIAADDPDLRAAVEGIMKSDDRIVGQAARNVLVLNSLMRHQAEQVMVARDLAEKAATPENLANLDRSWRQMQYLRIQFAMKAYAQGSGLAAFGQEFRLPSRQMLKDRKQAIEWLQKMGRGEAGGQELVTQLRGMDINNDSRLISSILRDHESGAWRRKAKRFGYRVYINNLLSSMRTAFGLTLGSPILIKAFEGAAATVGGLTMKGQRTRALRQTITNFRSNLANSITGLRFAAKAYATQKPIFANRTLIDSNWDTRAGSITSGPRWVTDAFYWGERLAIDLPSDTIMSLDEAAKQVFGRTSAMELIRDDIVSTMLNNARKAGEIGDTYADEISFIRQNETEIAKAVQTRFDRMIVEGQLQTPQARVRALHQSEEFRNAASARERAELVNRELNKFGPQDEAVIDKIHEAAHRPVLQGEVPENLERFMAWADNALGGWMRLTVFPFIRTPYKAFEMFFQYEPVTLTYAVWSSKAKNFFTKDTPERGDQWMNMTREERLAAQKNARTRRLVNKEGDRTTPMRAAPKAGVWRREWKIQPDSELGGIQRRLLEDLNSGDPKRIARARGQITAGYTLAATGLWMASEGVLTPSGSPDDRELNTTVNRPRGWQPESIKIRRGTNKETGEPIYTYVSINKADPFGLMLITYANMYELFTAEPEGGEQEKSGLLVRAAFAAINTLINRSYAKSAKDFIYALTTDEDTLTDWAVRQAATLTTPYGVLGNDIRRTMDPAITEAYDAVEEYRQRSWIGAAVLGDAPPKYNALGEPAFRWNPQSPGLTPYTNLINPFLVTHDMGDPVLAEFARVGLGSKPGTVYQGVELDSFPGPEGFELNAWHYMVQQKGAMTLSAHDLGLGARGEMLTQRQALMRVIEDDRYQKLSYEINPKTGVSHRYALLKKVQNAYENAARNLMLSKCPEVRVALGEQEIGAANYMRDEAMRLNPDNPQIPVADQRIKEAQGQLKTLGDQDVFDKLLQGQGGN